MTKWTARLGLAGVSLIAGIVSYFHALAVVEATGATAPVSYLVPFLADLVILSASAALLGSPGHRPPLAMVALAAGIGVTLAMNVAAGWEHGLAGALVAGWPAVAFILALESLGSILRPRSAATGGHAEPLSTGAALAALVASDSERNLEEILHIPRSRVQAWKRQLAAEARRSAKENGNGKQEQRGAVAEADCAERQGSRARQQGQPEQQEERQVTCDSPVGAAKSDNLLAPAGASLNGAGQ